MFWAQSTTRKYIGAKNKHWSISLLLCTYLYFMRKHNSKNFLFLAVHAFIILVIPWQKWTRWMNTVYITVHNRRTWLHSITKKGTQANRQCCLWQTGTMLVTMTKINVLGSNSCQLFNRQNLCNSLTTFSKAFQALFWFKNKLYVLVMDRKFSVQL